MELDWATCTGCKLTFIVKQSIEKVQFVTVSCLLNQNSLEPAIYPSVRVYYKIILYHISSLVTAVNLNLV